MTLVEEQALSLRAVAPPRPHCALGSASQWAKAELEGALDVKRPAAAGMCWPSMTL